MTAIPVAVGADSSKWNRKLLLKVKPNDPQLARAVRYDALRSRPSVLIPAIFSSRPKMLVIAPEAVRWTRAHAVASLLTTQRLRVTAASGDEIAPRILIL